MLHLKSFLYQSKLNWYIGSILFKSARTKYRTDACFPIGLNISHASLIFFIVCSAYSNVWVTFSEISFELCNVFASSASSIKLTFEFWIISKILSSKSSKSFFDFAILTIYSFLLFSQFGCSSSTTIPKSCSSSPLSLIEKLIKLTLVVISGA